MGSKLPRSLLVVALSAAMFVATAGQVGAAPAAPAMRTRTIVTLITGDRVVLGTASDGTSTARVLRTADEGPASQIKLVNLNGRVLAIPATAMAYFGRALDPSLFDVSALARAAFGDRMPLLIRYPAGTKPNVPGVTITSASAGIAHGFVTRRSAKDFGAALADQAVDDSLAGWPRSPTLFGVTEISPDAAVTPTVTPHFPQTTLIMKGISHTGGPMPFGFGILFNADDARRFAGEFIMYRGEARASVPLGTYIALLDEITFDRDFSFHVREIVATDVHVTGTQRELVLDARSATARASLTTPRPATPDELDTTLALSDETGHFSFSYGWGLGLPGAEIRFTPQPEPAVGSLAMDTRWIATDPSTPGGRYQFDATFSEPGIPADQARVLGPTSEAESVRNAFHAETSLQLGGSGRFVFLPHRFFASATYLTTPMPLHRTDYVYAPAGARLENIAFADGFAYDPGFVDGALLRYAPGASIDETWFRNPYSLVPPDGGAIGRVGCFVCISDTRMAFVFNVIDGDPSHSVEVFGGPGKPIAQFTVYRDGTQIYSKPDRLGAFLKIPTGDATYRVVNELNRRLTGSLLSSQIETDVTFDSAEAVPAPKRYVCFFGRGGCALLPVLTTAVDLHATDRGTVPIGPATFSVRVGHISDAAQPAIDAVTVEVRRTGSSTWRPLTLTPLGGGRYDANFKVMTWMLNRTFDLRVSATDEAGGSIVQTTQRAFLVSA